LGANSSNNLIMFNEPLLYLSPSLLYDDLSVFFSKT